MLSQAELETEGSGLATIFDLPPTPLRICRKLMLLLLLLFMDNINVSLCITPVAGSIFGSLSQTHISKSEFKNEILRSALLDIQVTLLCVCGVHSFIPELEHSYEIV